MNAFKTGLSWIAGWLFAAAPSLAQNFQIPWHNIGGGGGAGAGGVFALHGSIGQPVPSRGMAGGPFVLTSGFLSGFVAMQQPGIPTLAITAAGPNVTISWFPDSRAFVLQMTDSLDFPVWRDAANGGSSPVTMPVSGRMHYFRLRRP